MTNKQLLQAGIASGHVEIVDARKAPTPPVDFHYFNHGSICTLTAATDAAKQWADEHLPDDRQLWGQFGNVIEPRYVNDIIAGITGDGLTVQ